MWCGNECEWTFRERKVPWVLPGVMASKVRLGFLVQVVLRVHPEKTETRWSKDVKKWEKCYCSNIRLKSQRSLNQSARWEWSKKRQSCTSTISFISSFRIKSEQCVSGNKKYIEWTHGILYCKTKSKTSWSFFLSVQSYLSFSFQVQWA